MRNIDPLSILIGVIVAFIAQVSYDVIANIYDPSFWQNHLLAGITVVAELMFILLLFVLADSRRHKI